MQTGDERVILDEDRMVDILTQDAPVFGTLPSEDVPEPGAAAAVDSADAVLTAARALHIRRVGEGVTPYDPVAAPPAVEAEEAKGSEGLPIRYRTIDGAVRLVAGLTGDNTWWDVSAAILAQELRIRGVAASGDAAKLSVVLYAWSGVPLLSSQAQVLDKLSDWGVEAGECFHALLVPSVDDVGAAAGSTGLDPDDGPVAVAVEASSGAKYTVQVRAVADESIFRLCCAMFRSQAADVTAIVL